MPARKEKHLTKKERKALNSEAEPFISIKGAPRLVNALIDMGECAVGLDNAVKMLQKINDHVKNNKTVVLCSHCAQKIGVKRCSRCPRSSPVRYCSRECQVLAWPAHQETCGVDVD